MAETNRKEVTFRFYAALNDFLTPTQRWSTITHSFNGNPSIKHLLETLGVPHPEVDLILVNSEPVGFGYTVQQGDRVAVYPRFHSIEIRSITRVRPEPLTDIRFVLDNHLGKLATYLRMLDMDTLYQNDYQDEALAQISHEQDRILLTRDRGLLMRGKVRYGYCLRAKIPRAQLLEILHHFRLYKSVRPFQRCLRCNHPLRPVEKARVLHRLEPKTKRYYDEFFLCPDCDQVYWKGSHYQRMQRFIQAVLEEKQ